MNIRTLFEFSFDASSPQATLSNNTVQSQTNLSDLNFEVFECLYSPSIYSIAAKTQRPELWGGIYDSGGVTQGRLRVGRELRATSDAKTSWGEWSTVRLKRIWTQVEGASVSVKLTAADEMLYLKNRVPRNMYKQKTVNEIIAQILDENKIKNSEVDAFSSTKYTLCQCGMSDFEFITEVLLPRVSKKPVHFYTRNGNVICIKERKYKSPVASFSYNETNITDDKVPMGPVISSLDINTSNFGVLGVSFDTQKDQKEPFLVENLIADSVKDYMDPVVTKQPTSLSIDNFPGKIKNIVVETLAVDVVDELKSRVVPEFQQTMHRLVIFSYMLPLLKLGDIINVDLATIQGFKLAGSGMYLVYALYHHMFHDRTGTVVFAERRGSMTK